MHALCAANQQSKTAPAKKQTHGGCAGPLPSPKIAPGLQIFWSILGLECRYFPSAGYITGLSGTVPEHTSLTPGASCENVLVADATITCPSAPIESCPGQTPPFTTPALSKTAAITEASDTSKSSQSHTHLCYSTAVTEAAAVTETAAVTEDAGTDYMCSSECVTMKVSSADATCVTKQQVS